MAENQNVIDRASKDVLDQREKLLNLFNHSPIPSNELLVNLGLYIRSQSLKRILFMDFLYKQIVNVHGDIAEFGVRWGQNLALFSSFRDIYEPFNLNRKIIGFDTFAGFPCVHNKDGIKDWVKNGNYAVVEGYEKYLEDILDYHEKESPITHIKRFELVKGDATKTLKEFLENNPHTIFSLLYFDFDIYKPTKECLELISGHITKGTIIGFDELNVKEWPGETVALKEVFGLDKYAIKRLPSSGNQSYIVIE